jgi:glucose/arabinose dehydrogenase
MAKKLILLTAIFALGLACEAAPPTAGVGEVETAQGGEVRFRIETVAEGLEVPWALAFTPDGRILVTERPGRIRVVENGKLRPEPYATIPDVEPSSESGLMDLSLHPRYAENRWVYVAYAYGGDRGKLVRVVRFRDTGRGLEDRKVIVERIPAAPNHAGTRARFGPDGMLYVTTGDATSRRIAQEMDSLGGKTLRLTEEGAVPPDNPFVGRSGVRPEIWSVGHRNAQGLDWQPGTGLMFQTEHGPSGFDGPGGGDEVNIVERGKNYGWPTIHHEQKQAGLEAPLLEYTPSCAPGSGTFYRGSAFPQFSGNFFFGCLRGTSIVRVVLDGRRVVSQERMFQGKFGRIRDVATGPDGALYFTTSNRDGRGRPASNDDRILRLVPVK